MSRYKNMTAAEIIRDVNNFGLTTDTESICDIQDVFGNTDIEELDKLANDIGRNNENGEPDPNGSWSSSRVPTRDNFYFVLFHIWCWEDAVRFYNQHTDPRRKQYEKTLEENGRLADELNEAERKHEEVTKLYQRGAECRKVLENKVTEMQETITDKDMEIERLNVEIMRLKARLYDMMEEKN